MQTVPDGHHDSAAPASRPLDGGGGAEDGVAAIVDTSATDAPAPTSPASRPPAERSPGGVGAPAGRPRRRSAVRLNLVPRDGLVTGLAAGIGHRLGVPIAAIRVALLVLTFAGGAGVIAYLALWVISEPGEAPGQPPGGPVARRKALALVPLLWGVLLLLREVGLWFGDGLVWPLAVAGVGALLIGSRSDDPADAAEEEEPVPTGQGRGAIGRLFTAPGLRASRRRTVARVLAGGFLVAVGMTLFLAATESMAAVNEVAPAVVVTVVGLGLIAGPLIYRLGRQLADERSDRIRSQERADMAAHLHDSVLQTLAMIQRSSSAREMTTLARAQERELRAWLFAEGPQDAGLTLREALEDMAGKAERRFQMSVDPVVVGDLPADEAVLALVDAAGEAVTNAGKHAGVDSVSLYVEVEPDQVTAFVRDDGRGFDRDAVGPDRRGISHSICDRLARHRGRATVETGPGRGTEWQLQIPRSAT